MLAWHFTCKLVLGFARDAQNQLLESLLFAGAQDHGLF